MDYRGGGDITQGAEVINQQAVRRQEERRLGLKPTNDTINTDDTVAAKYVTVSTATFTQRSCDRVAMTSLYSASFTVTEPSNTGIDVR